MYPDDREEGPEPDTEPDDGLVEDPDGELDPDEPESPDRPVGEPDR